MWDDTYFPEGQGSDISVRRSDDGTLVVVSVSGALDISAGPSLGTTLREEGENEPAALVVDLTSVSVLTSSGVPALLEAYRTGKDRLRLVVDTDHVRRPLDLMGVTQVIPTFRTLAEAVPVRRDDSRG